MARYTRSNSVTVLFITEDFDLKIKYIIKVIYIYIYFIMYLFKFNPHVYIYIYDSDFERITKILSVVKQQVCFYICHNY